MCKIDVVERNETGLEKLWIGEEWTLNDPAVIKKINLAKCMEQM